MPARSCALALCALALAVSGARAGGMSCSVSTQVGTEDTFVLHNAPSGLLNCIMVENDAPPPTAKSVLSDNKLTYDVCNLEQKDKVVSYQVSATPTGMKCKYECRPSKLRCKATPAPGADKCDCIQTGPTPALVPLTADEHFKVLIQSGSSSLPSNLCDGKETDAVIGTEVNCQRISKEYPEETLTLFNEQQKLCLIKPHPHADTDKTYGVYESFVGPSGKACKVVCRPTGYKKAGYGDCRGIPCPCEQGLAPKLVPVEGAAADFDADAPCKKHADGTDSCGWCGKCDDTGKCMLKAPGLDKANHCPCGYRCPSDTEVSERTRHFGVPLACVRNKMCQGEGTAEPDYCISDENSDLADRCGCAPGYKLAFDENNPEKQICSRE